MPKIEFVVKNKKVSKYKRYTNENKGSSLSKQGVGTVAHRYVKNSNKKKQSVEVIRKEYGTDTLLVTVRRPSAQKRALCSKMTRIKKNGKRECRRYVRLDGVRYFGPRGSGAGGTPPIKKGICEE